MTRKLSEIVEKKLSEMHEVPIEVFRFHHTFNPLAFYCRLKGLGFCHECADDLTKTYEETIYEFIVHEINQKYGK